MILQTLTIGLKNSDSAPSPTNPYQAKLSISYNDNAMQVALSDKTCRSILALAADELAVAAQIQISDFVRQALTVSRTPMVEGVAKNA
jgi:hypothetical protein